MRVPFNGPARVDILTEMVGLRVMAGSNGFYSYYGFNKQKVCESRYSYQGEKC
jgi:hypothetical protein